MIKNNNLIKLFLLVVFFITTILLFNLTSLANSSADTTAGITLDGWAPGENNGSGGGNSGDGDNGGNENNKPDNKPDIPVNTVVYGIQSIYLYKTPTLYKKDRIATYTKKPRVNRPMFIVIGYGHSKSGLYRYKVRDVNHKSKTKNKIGYITARKDFVRKVYYQKKYSRITVISPQGINSYKKISLKNKKNHYKQGKVLKIKKIVKHNLTTRYVLTNGNYISANRKLVQYGTVKYARQIKVKKNINLYKTVNLKHKKKVIKKGTKLKIKALYYSFADNTKIHGSKRYLINGGYVSGNKKLVKAMR